MHTDTDLEGINYSMNIRWKWKPLKTTFLFDKICESIVYDWLAKSITVFVCLKEEYQEGNPLQANDAFEKIECA